LLAVWQSFWPAAATPKHFSFSAASAALLSSRGLDIATATADARKSALFID
jgi:hypothetical protein